MQSRDALLALALGLVGNGTVGTFGADVASARAEPILRARLARVRGAAFNLACHARIALGSGIVCDVARSAVITTRLSTTSVRICATFFTLVCCCVFKHSRNTWRAGKRQPDLICHGALTTCNTRCVPGQRHVRVGFANLALVHARGISELPLGTRKARLYSVQAIRSGFACRDTRDVFI